MRVKLAAGNWKMNGTGNDLAEARKIAFASPAPRSEVLICPPATLLTRMADSVMGSPLRLGGQDCHAEPAGAHTGDISAPMLADAGATHVIVGHSERRSDHGETDAMVRAKARAAHAAGLVAIICIGETEAERDAGRTLDVIRAQLAGSIPEGAGAANTVIAYEPVWAIGSGRTPAPAEIAEVHGTIRAAIVGAVADPGAVRILYGGSVKPGNAAEIFAIADVDGALVGGASLKAADFGAIIAALDAA
ncbi:triose-phosphate isomerase [Albidovulum sp.]